MPILGPLPCRTSVLLAMLVVPALGATPGCGGEGDRQVQTGAGGSVQRGGSSATNTVDGSGFGGIGGDAGGGDAGGAVTTGETGGVGGASTGGAGSNVPGGAGSGATAPCADDACPFANGITWQCRKRFMYGVNLPWGRFGADFGGDASGRRGISTNTTIAATLQTMAANGVSVVRWWIWPNFQGSGVQFDASGVPTGLGGSALADLQAALSLADQNNLYLMPTLFSFDNFKNTNTRNLAGIATDPARRAALVDNAVRPFVRAAEQSSFARRVIAWDVINEPEWAITGPSLYGTDPPFEPQLDVTPISHGEMETLLAEVIAGIRAESQAQVTVGAAAMKWKNAWLRLDQDFYQFHMYDWINAYWPYTRSPSNYGVSAKPVVMGEFPPGGLSAGAISYATILDSWYSNGYAGALVWRDSTFVVNWSDLKAFADAHPCETRY